MTSPSEATPSAPEIVPRWEWRTFGDDLAGAEQLLATRTPHSVVDSDEIYFLSAASDASVKVRDALMDVKHLVRVDDHGLELWMPVMKATLPLSSSDTTTLLATWNLPVPVLRHTEYTVDELIDDIVHPNPELLAVPVHKRRSRYIVDDCMVELTEVSAHESTTRTLAIESSDADLVWSTVSRFGLGGRPNTSVARGLKALVGFGTQRYAVIDVGTNSVKFHLGERRAGGSMHTVVDRAEITRLGEGLSESGALADDAIARTVDAVAGMVDEANRNGALAIAAVGTAGLRQAPNRDEFVDAVSARCGLMVEVISGEEEGRLAYVAAMSALPVAGGELVVFDSGGGSTQFTFGHGDHLDARFSVDVGAVRISERFGLAGTVPADVLAAALAEVASELARLDEHPPPDAIVAIGGTATNLAAVKHGLVDYDPDVVQGTVLDLTEIDRQIELYRTHDTEQRRDIVGLQPARAEVILAGACIVRTILTQTGHDSLTVSDRGLRHGVFAERFGR